MQVGQRLRELREAKNWSQGDIEKRTGLFRCYTSRVENGHTIPSVETLEKYARALEIPLYKLFYDGDGSPEKLKLTTTNKQHRKIDAKERRQIRPFVKALSKMSDRQRNLLLAVAGKLAKRQV
jgi:transcriptional regulator with XRE-family HTH domain